MKRIILLLFISFTFVGLSQQIPLKSLYQFSRLAFNPSEAGTRDYMPIYFSGRIQWQGMNDAPNSQDIMLHARIGKSFGLGGHFYNETAGITSRTGGAISISYITEVSNNTGLSFALSPIFTQFSFDREKIVVQNPNDALLTSSTAISYFIPDVAFGATFFGKTYRVGVSGVNLLQSGKDLSNQLVTSTLDRIIYFDGIVEANLSNKVKLIPSFYGRFMMNAPFQFDGNLRMMFNDAFWLGVGYRLQDAAVLELGFDIKNFIIGYAYDYTLSDINTVSNGTHEIMVGYQIDIDRSPKTSRWNRRNRIYLPQK